MSEILRFEHVHYAYEEGREALHDLSLTIHSGEKIAVLGNNGAGKSTFFLLCNGVLAPKQGKIFLEGTEVKPKRLTELRRKVGLVFQNPDVQIIAGSVEDEISFGPINLGLQHDEVLRRVDSAITALRMESLRGRAPQYLSGGEKKRVTIGDVLAMEPQLLLLDEPAASLDPRSSRLLEENLIQLSGQGLSLVVATHDVDFAWRWADRVLLFSDGHLLLDGTPEEAFGNDLLLEQCALEKPTLYQVGKLLGLSPIPRTVAELKTQLP